MDIKEILLNHLRSSREALLWKTEGLSERELRLPRTVTGTNLLGLVKHCAFVEHGYFIDCFARTSPIVIPALDYGADPNADFYATRDERAVDLVRQYREVGQVVDSAIEEMPLETPGRVAWWGERGETTLARILVHVLNDITRHAGQADIIREGIDGAAGLLSGNTNLWVPAEGWAAHRTMLTRLADEA
ncbi:DinB family protein [Tessaracoccus sp. MC1679]|uniref:DinB family protein n=1 Tax=Tessaracoccus sp. MC1679 TaxID=2760313 RepID=UPI0016034452|nr:DinB family protein [Tessaracoccus sp. MC1679]MBB1516427.1 DinB family protein [Tessaracoccus sp. MC1679]